MKLKSIFWALSLLILILFFSAFAAAADPLTVYTVNYPLQYFTERIGGEHVKVVFPAPSDGDPAYWKPDQQAVSAYQKADLIMLNGAGYAKWVAMVSLPRSKTVNTTAALSDRYMQAEAELNHTHGPAGEHAHAAIAFTTWLDFDIASRQAMAIYEALSRKRPELKATFNANYTILKNELFSLDSEMQAIVQRNQLQPLVVSHPVYQYLARRYGMQIKSVHWEPREAPKSVQWNGLQEILILHPAKWMLWEGDPLPGTVDRLSASGIASMVFDPCGNKPKHGNFMDVMRQNIENLKMVYQ